MEIKLHHFAYNIQPSTLEIVIELFEKLGLDVAYMKKDARWCMFMQKGIPIDIQIIETEDRPIGIEQKTSTHIAFLSDTPKEHIEGIERWFDKKKIRIRKGSWSDKEMWFDLPDIFVNFVIEIMHTSVVE